MTSSFCYSFLQKKYQFFLIVIYFCLTNSNSLAFLTNDKSLMQTLNNNCSINEFTCSCHIPKCIPLNLRRNGIADCADASDEFNDAFLQSTANGIDEVCANGKLSRRSQRLLLNDLKQSNVQICRKSNQNGCPSYLNQACVEVNGFPRCVCKKGFFRLPNALKQKYFPSDACFPLKTFSAFEISENNTVTIRNCTELLNNLINVYPNLFTIVKNYSNKNNISTIHKKINDNNFILNDQTLASRKAFLKKLLNTEPILINTTFNSKKSILSDGGIIQWDMPSRVQHLNFLNKKTKENCSESINDKKFNNESDEILESFDEKTKMAFIEKSTALAFNNKNEANKDQNNLGLLIAFDGLSIHKCDFNDRNSCKEKNKICARLPDSENRTTPVGQCVGKI